MSSLRRLTLGDLVRRYLATVTPNKKSRVAETYVLEAFLRRPLCTKRLSDLGQVDFARYRDQRLAEIESSSLRRELNPIQNMFEIARDEWGIPLRVNPLRGMRLKATDNKRERRLKEGEFERLAEAVGKLRNPHVSRVVLFALETAMRRGEILALCWDQVDLDRACVTVLEAKNGYSRTIPLTPKALALLRAIEGRQGRVFPITANALKLAWVRTAKVAGLEDLHFHDLRHEAISRLFELGLSVPEVSLISGHRDMRMLMRYAHGELARIQQKLASS
jgi:integrase